MNWTKQVVKTILQNATAYKWSLQGFGMLRLHIGDEYRLNIWDSKYRIPNVSMIHTHPWNFISIIIAGSLRNVRYEEHPSGKLYTYANIIPGVEGAKGDKLGEVKLLPSQVDTLSEGETYRQLYREIHQSKPADGTVTLNCRQRVGEDIAKVYWLASEEWIAGFPRPALPEEIENITKQSLSQWF